MKQVGFFYSMENMIIGGMEIEPFFCLSGQNEVHTALGFDAKCPTGKHPGAQPANRNDRA